MSRSMWCPECDGLMVLTTVDVGFSQAVHPVPDSVVMCVTCPCISQIDDRGNLIDIPGWHLEDLRQVPDSIAAEGSPYMHTARRPTLQGRRDS